ncbi:MULTISPECIES: hypothetical protein [Microbacterium]|uniref:hypothetical protein n=1 Tax=Microbacterium TaxID=33882 RepID=UPI001B7D26C2|nr:MULTISPECIES: hypothetical protein [Microbacterium]
MSTIAGLREIVEEQRALADRLALLLAELEGGTADSIQPGSPIFDPDIDEPPMRPSIDGNRAQLDWVSIMIWSRLAALNVREHRGASRDEYVQWAKEAGYRDGRGWNRWDGYDDLSDGRWINGVGIGHLRAYCRRQNRSIPDDIASWANDGCVPE